jgi:hypothetical protein
VTFIDCAGHAEIDQTTGEEKQASYRRPHVTTVFHISQTEPTAERDARIAAGRPLGSGPLDWPRGKRLAHARKVRRMSTPTDGYPDPRRVGRGRSME